MSGPLHGQVAWISGASSGIGLASARLLAQDGATVVLTARDAANLEHAADELRGLAGPVHAVAADVTDGAAVQAAAQHIAAGFGGVDILVNSAGLNVARRAWSEVEPPDWQRVFDVNVTGTYHCIRAVLPGMRAKGAGLVINIASWAGRFPSGKAGPAYNAAKSAVIALTQTLNMEEHRHGIRACALSPGETATPIMARRAVPPTPQELARMLQPDDVAAVVQMVARMPPRACVNEVVITPTANHAWR
ncbi:MULTISPECIES: SDR family oxidoreductase [Ramlibacter]|uniref:SDR family NAD(P)-dependent oxidoreductase n=1 Tax=Ramlibacter pinisoli TaxID=2682844 RepID=A0A6N8IRK6_9BURK|nr:MULTISPECIES: SDR family oxidoreductase [Ramlibacter]MBA2963537.1 SDR family oxidoreductase [Ramlibacter sp. CGMCC 1.13660]MVQ28503.1 SDR family NAD(P)-dependent oxidoreductase [Ramlibacter pinisoli]